MKLASALLLLSLLHGPALFAQAVGTSANVNLPRLTVSQAKAAESAWFAHVQALASDDLKGRKTGTPEFLRAADYVQAQFQSAGLRPLGTIGFRQPVPFETVSVDTDASSFRTTDQNGNARDWKVGADIILQANEAGDVKVETPAVFAGYGLVVPQLGIDNLRGLDLRGKVAVVVLAAPHEVHGPLKAYFRTVGIRWKALKDAGAIGVIAIQPPRKASANVEPASHPTSARPLDRLADPALNPTQGAKIVATVPAEHAAGLFAGTDHNVDEILQRSDAGESLQSFPLSVSIRSTIATNVRRQFDAPNVVGVLDGSDPSLKHEYLILSAHLDHLGEGKAVGQDSIYNGAMDNAVGIASLVEVARSLAHAHPRRSVIFLALTGEEEGELGSQFYARYPTIPRSSIIACLNMDMYLPLFPLRFLEVQGLGESTLGNEARAAAQLNDIEVQFDKQPDQNRFIRSDQASFVKYGIPALAFKFGWLPDSPEQKAFNDWIQNRYHHPNDDLSQPIDAEAAVHFDHVLMTLALRVANSSARPAWYPESFFAGIRRQ